MTTSDQLPAQALATPVQYLKGVGPSRLDLMQRLDLRTARDVLFFFPRAYEDLTDQREIDKLEENKVQSVRGIVEEVELRGNLPGKCILGVLLHCPTGYLRGLWFNQPFMQEKFVRGQGVIFSGKPKLNGLVWEMTHPRVETLASDDPEPGGRILPVYPLTEGLQQWHIRRIVRDAIDDYLEYLEEIFPDDYLTTHDLWPLRRALPQLHFPEDFEKLGHARRRLVYQELFLLGLALAVKRYRQQAEHKAPSMQVTAQIDARIKRLFPFELTAGQRQAIEAIATDMGRPAPMNRLLQGDVGSGKTIVALYAMLLAIAHGYQAVLMAPTEVLARQHGLTIARLLSTSQVRRAELTGGMTASKRTALIERIAAGEVDLVIGTQAILQEDVRFAKLGVVVIDEQHKFGVRQRATLKHSGLDPHHLVMTATPIPRTMTMTLFGDLDVSTLPDFPPGRQKVNTYHADDEKRKPWWEFVRKKLREGRQGFVVTPLVEESDQFAAVSLEETYETLANGELEEFRLGLIHGRMTTDEKDAVMQRFRQGEIQVLVSTSVIEVGVDIPNATLMTIESGERFGLAQLHQMRGRISRGAYPGFCCVFASPRTPEAEERLKAFVSTTDGFELAEVDFKLRGPGEIFGTRQHGLPPLRIADLIRDEAILIEALRDALALVAEDSDVSLPKHALLKTRMLARYGKVLELGDVG